MSPQAQDYPLPGSAPPPGAFATYSFSFERLISPPRRSPALPHADLQPNRLWHCSLAAPGESHAPGAAARKTVPPLAFVPPRLPELQPAVAAAIDPAGQLLAISAAPASHAAPQPGSAGGAIPPKSISPTGPVRDLRFISGAGGVIRPDFYIRTGAPEGLLRSRQSQVRFAESPMPRADWPVIGGSMSLAPAPLLEWQIEAGRERRRNLPKQTPQPAKSIILPDSGKEATPEASAKARAVSFQITRGMKRWLALAASLAIAALGATRFGPQAIDSLNKTLEPRAAFVFFDDPATGAGPWWPPENFIETADRTFTVAGLALNRSTIGRGDLRFDFDVKAGPGGFGWVAGARDEKNYLAYKLTSKGRRKKEYVLLRYPVVNGEPDAKRRDEFPVSADLFEEEFNKISVRVRDDRLTVLINGQGVDYWTNPGAVRGGVGFFAEKGDSPSIRSVRVDGNDDFTGLMARGTIDTLKGVRELLAGESEARESVAGREPRATGPTD